MGQRSSHNEPPPSGRVRLGRVMWFAAALLVLLVVACGTDDRDGGDTTTTREPDTTTTSTTATTTSTTTSTTLPSVLADDWVGTGWTPGTDAAAGAVLVDGAPVGLTSITGLCQGDGCAFGIDLLTDAPTGAAPAPGPYLLWASRLVGRSADGLPSWQVSDQRSLTLAPGTSPASCQRVADAAATALGVIAIADAQPGGFVTPEQVWIVSDGRLATPEPAEFTCEIGDD